MANLYFSRKPEQVTSLYGYSDHLLQRQADNHEVSIFQKIVELFDESGDPIPTPEEIKTIDTPLRGKFITDGYQTVVVNLEPISNPNKGLIEVWQPFVNKLSWEDNLKKLKKLFKFEACEIPRIRLFNLTADVDEYDDYKNIIESSTTKTYMSPNGDILVEDTYDFFVIS